jgi:hypothetical protein
MSLSFRRTRTALAAAATAVALLPTAADAATTPPVTLGSVRCVAGGILQAYPPSVMRPVGASVDFRNPEIVKWSPDLQVARNGRWVNYDTSRPFYMAFTSSYGYFQTAYMPSAWTSTTTNASMTFVPFNGLAAGRYRIRNWLYWDKLGKTFYANGGTCRFV